MANAFCGCLSTLLRRSNGYKHTQKQTLRTNPSQIVAMVLEITFWAHPELCWDEECGPSSRRLVWREKPPTPPGGDLTHHLLGFWVGGPGARGWELRAESGFSPWSRVGQVRFGNIPQLWFFKKIAQCSSPRFPGTRSVAEEWVKSEATFTLEKPMWIRRREVYLGFKFVRNAWLCKSAVPWF